MTPTPPLPNPHRTRSPHPHQFGECQISLRDMAAIEEKDAQIAAAAAKAEVARAKIVAEAAAALAAIELQRALAERKAAIDAALAAEQVKIKAAAAAAAIAAAIAAAEAKIAADEAAMVAEAAVIEQQHAIAEARAATDAAAAVLANQQHEFAEAGIAIAVAAATMVANVAFGACAAASAAYITEKAKTRPVIVEQAKAHAAVRAFMTFMATVADSSTALEFQRNENKAKQGLRNRQRTEEKQQKQMKKLQEKLDQQQQQQTQQNYAYRPLKYEIVTIWEDFEIDGLCKAVAREVPEAPTAPIKASRPHCSAAATAATGSCRLGRNQQSNRTRANTNIPIKNAVKVKLANVLAEPRYLGAAVAPKLQSSARHPFVSAHSKVVKVNANTNVVRAHAPQLAGKHVAPMIVNAAHIAKARASMAFGSTTARFAAAAR